MNARPIKIATILLVVGAATAGAFPAPAPPAKSGKDVSALEQKLHGSWKGQGGCVGNFTFEPVGSFVRTNFGPVACKMEGAWEVRWDALPPTLVLTCKSSNDEDDVGKVIEVKIIELDNANFACQFRDEEAPKRYKRLEK
jgi:hypothetical protein